MKKTTMLALIELIANLLKRLVEIFLPKKKGE